VWFSDDELLLQVIGVLPLLYMSFACVFTMWSLRFGDYYHSRGNRSTEESRSPLACLPAINARSLDV
jgi:hypothetical protein